MPKALIELLPRQSSSAQAVVRVRASEAITRVEVASRVEWIPLATQLEILAAYREALGPRGYDDLCIAHFAASLEQPFVKGLFDTTVRLFGLGPAPIYKAFARAWNSGISRHAGTMSVEDAADTSLVVRLAELPMDEKELDLFVFGFRATFQGVIDVAGVRGDVAEPTFDRATASATYRARWSPSE